MASLLKIRERVGRPPGNEQKKKSKKKKKRRGGGFVKILGLDIPRKRGFRDAHSLKRENTSEGHVVSGIAPGK